MKNKERIITSWLQSRDEDLEVAKHLIKKGYRVQGLFFCHLTIEKHLKAIFVDRQSQHPPPIHDLPKIAEKAGLNLDDATVAQLSEMTSFNIRARYDERVFEFHRIATKEYAKQWLKTTEELLRLIPAPKAERKS